MNCTFCFAEPDGTQDPSLDTVKRWINDLTEPGKTLLQLSGGEPTVRDDLPEIVAYAKQVGCKYVQLNSNGLRLAICAGQGWAGDLLHAAGNRGDAVSARNHRMIRGFISKSIHH